MHIIELKHLDPSAPFPAQLQGPHGGQPVTLVNASSHPKDGSTRSSMSDGRTP
ncbi:hypothetical protein [Streptomyces sp. NPDC006285]|uniref:hypothetical protein n=1 Tax=Streptomyces sp. NPDC006285 TaxID=3364742 RepID=UPI0036A89374